MTSKIVLFLFLNSLCFAFPAGKTNEAQDEINLGNHNPENLNLNEENAQKEGSNSLRKKCFRPTEASRQTQISTQLSKAEEDLIAKNIQLAKITTKLAELEKHIEAEKITDLTQQNQLTQLQRNLLTELAESKDKKEDLTLDISLAKTLVEQLQIILVANGGSIGTSDTNNPTIQNQIKRQIARAQYYQQKVNDKLANTKLLLEQLENQKTAQNINVDNETTNLTQAQRDLLKQIEGTKAMVYGLTTESAVTSTLIEQLQLLLNDSSNTSENTSADNSSSTTDNLM